MITTIIFDYGNTLVYSASLATSLERLLENPKGKRIGQAIENEIQRLYQRDQVLQPDWRSIWQRCFAEHEMSFSEEIGMAHLREFCRAGITHPQSVPLLQELSDRGFRLGLLSNVTGPASLFQDDLRFRGMAQFFDEVVWSSAIGFRKPGAACFNHILSQLEADPKQTLMIGDSELADVEGGQSVGLHTARIVTGEGATKADYSICSDHLQRDTLAVIDKLLRPRARYNGLRGG